MRDSHRSEVIAKNSHLHDLVNEKCIPLAYSCSKVTCSLSAIVVTAIGSLQPGSSFEKTKTNHI